MGESRRGTTPEFTMVGCTRLTQRRDKEELTQGVVYGVEMLGQGMKSPYAGKETTSRRPGRGVRTASCSRSKSGRLTDGTPLQIGAQVGSGTDERRTRRVLVHKLLRVTGSSRRGALDRPVLYTTIGPAVPLRSASRQPRR